MATAFGEGEQLAQFQRSGALTKWTFPSSTFVGIPLVNRAEPPQIQAGPQGPRWLMSMRKGFRRSTRPLISRKKKKQFLFELVGTATAGVDFWQGNFCPTSS